MFFTLPMTAVRSLENEVMTMVQGCESFLDRHTGDVPDHGSDADMSQFLINSAGMVSNDLHYLDAGGNGTPSGTSTTETQSIHILGYIYLYKATKNVAFLEKAKRFWQSYFDVFYLGQPVPAAAKEFRCHWMVNAKQPFNAAYPINQEQSSHSGWKGVQLTATGNTIQVPDDQTYFGSQLQKVTFAFRDTDILVWDAINARVTQSDWNDKGHVYEVDWFINYKGQKLNPDGDKVDDTVYPDAEKGKIHLSGRVFKESTDGALLESNKDFDGMTVKVNFCTANGPVIGRNQPFDPRPLWTPLKPGWQGNASDAEQWFGDACFQLWEITREDKYRIMHECVVLTCKGYCDIDRGQLFWRKDKNASSPYSDGIGYVFSNEDDIADKNALFFRNRTTGFNVLDLSQVSGTDKDIVLEQQAVWYKLKPESKLSTEIAAAAPPQAVTLSLVSYVLIGTEKTDDEKVGTQTWFRMPNFPNLSPVPAVNDQLISGAYVIDGNSRFADHTDASPYGEEGSIVHSASQHNDMAGYSGESALFEYVPYKKPDNTFPYAGTDGFWYNLANYGSGDKYVVGHNLVFRLWDEEGGADTNTWEISFTEHLPDGNTKDHDGEISGPQNTWVVQSIADIVGHEITNPIESFTANPKHVNSMNKRYFEFYCMNAPTKYDPAVHGLYLLRHRLQAKTTAPLTIYVGDCFVKEYAEDNLKYTPGMIPFSNNYNPDTNQYDSWQGMPFMGYQYGWIWKDDPVYWNNSVQALHDAQKQYHKNWANGDPVVGPSCAGFVWNRWDNVGYGPINTFVNTVWGNQRPWDGYQARTALAVGRMYEQMKADGNDDPRLTDSCNMWVNFLYDFQAKNGGKFPDYFPKDTPDAGDPDYPINKWGFVGHIVGNYLTAVSKMAMAGLDNAHVYDLIEALYQDIKRNYYIGAANYHMNGCWSESPGTGQFFGFWAGDLYKALAHYLLFQQYKGSVDEPTTVPVTTVDPGTTGPTTGGTTTGDWTQPPLVLNTGPIVLHPYKTTSSAPSIGRYPNPYDPGFRGSVDNDHFGDMAPNQGGVRNLYIQRTSKILEMNNNILAFLHGGIGASTSNASSSKWIGADRLELHITTPDASIDTVLNYQKDSGGSQYVTDQYVSPEAEKDALYSFFLTALHAGHPITFDITPQYDTPPGVSDSKLTLHIVSPDGSTVEQHDGIQYDVTQVGTHKFKIRDLLGADVPDTAVYDWVIRVSGDTTHMFGDDNIYTFGLRADKNNEFSVPIIKGGTASLYVLDGNRDERVRFDIYVDPAIVPDAVPLGWTDGIPAPAPAPVDRTFRMTPYLKTTGQHISGFFRDDKSTANGTLVPEVWGDLDPNDQKFGVKDLNVFHYNGNHFHMGVFNGYLGRDGTPGSGNSAKWMGASSVQIKLENVATSAVMNLDAPFKGSGYAIDDDAISTQVNTFITDAGHNSQLIDVYVTPVWATPPGISDDKVTVKLKPHSQSDYQDLTEAAITKVTESGQFDLEIFHSGAIVKTGQEDWKIIQVSERGGVFTGHNLTTYGLRSNKRNLFKFNVGSGNGFACFIVYDGERNERARFMLQKGDDSAVEGLPVNKTALMFQQGVAPTFN
ncbi:TPA: hypothetical protein P0E30_003769 [Vibrio harveyi]|nr:hypothetical protein [Vibrio harveyi]